MSDTTMAEECVAHAMRMDIINKGGSPEWSMRGLGDRLISYEEMANLHAELAEAKAEAEFYKQLSLRW